MQTPSEPAFAFALRGTPQRSQYSLLGGSWSSQGTELEANKPQHQTPAAPPFMQAALSKRSQHRAPKGPSLALGGPHFWLDASLP